MSRRQLIEGVHVKKGALHKQLDMGVHEHISTALLDRIDRQNVGTHVNGVTVTPLLKKRARFARNMRRF
jgi:hypothetical protein